MRPGESGLEDFKLQELKQKTDRLAELIKAGISQQDFFAKEKQIKQFCIRRYPDKAELYDLIYRSRFKRIWQQFRQIEIEFQNGD